MVKHINAMLLTKKKTDTVEAAQGQVRVHVKSSYGKQRVLKRVTFTAWCASDAQRAEVEDVVAQVREQQALQPAKSVLSFVATSDALDA